MEDSSLIRNVNLLGEGHLKSWNQWYVRVLREWQERQVPKAAIISALMRSRAHSISAALESIDHSWTLGCTKWNIQD